MKAVASPPATVSKTSTEGTPDNRPLPLKMFQSAKAPYGPRQGKYQEIFLKKEKTGYFLPIT